jgi:AmmeMemoRadiSam system protein A
MDFTLTTDQKKLLLHIARNAIAGALGINNEPVGSDGLLQLKLGAFVTIHKQGNLRGCIGMIVASRPLGETINEMALSAAFHDPRFPKLKESEYPLIDIEISILSPVSKVNSVEEITVGIHGLIVTKGFSRGLLLPQVAVENNWDRDTFLNHTCMKAGLAPDSWKDTSCGIEKFSAVVFGEKDTDIL